MALRSETLDSIRIKLNAESGFVLGAIVVSHMKFVNCGCSQLLLALWLAQGAPAAQQPTRVSTAPLPFRLGMTGRGAYEHMRRSPPLGPFFVTEIFDDSEHAADGDIEALVGSTL